MNEQELINAVLDGKIDIERMQNEINDMKKKKEILEQHKIWFNEREGYWYCSIPDPKRPGKKKNCKSKNRDKIEAILIENYGQDLVIGETVHDLFDMFIKWKTGTVGSGTIKRMVADWNRFYVPHPEFTGMPYKSITKLDVDRLFQKFVSGGDLKIKAFNNAAGILKQMLQYAVDGGMITASPYRVNVNKKMLIPDKKKSSEKEVYQGDEKEIIIREMYRRLENTPWNTAPLFVVLGFELGTRRGEELAIAESDIVNGRLHIHRQLVERFDVSDINNIKSLGWEIVERTKSSAGDRWIPLTDRALEIIEQIREINRENGWHYKDYLFVRDGEIMNPDCIDTQIIRGCKYAGIPVKTMHKIRKTYASNLYENGVPVPIIKEMLGHEDESTTIRHYLYNVNDEETTDQIVLDALQGKKEPEAEVGQREIREVKVIPFRAKEKAGKPFKQGLPANS